MRTPSNADVFRNARIIRQSISRDGRIELRIVRSAPLVIVLLRRILSRLRRKVRTQLAAL